MIQKTFFYGVVLLWMTMFFMSCKKDKSPGDFASKYKYPIPKVQLTSNAIVGAIYANHSATEWGRVHSDTSLLGKPYNPISDAAIFPRQFAWANEAGVDFLMMRWNSGTTDNSLLSSFGARHNGENVKMVIAYNTAHLSATNTSPLRGTKLQNMLNEFKTLYDSYISKNYYYKLNNRPVIVISPLNLPSNAINSIDYKYVVDTLRIELGKLGINPFIIGEFTTGWTAPSNYLQEQLAAMDAIFLSAWNTSDFDRWWSFYSFADLSYANWKTSLEQSGTEYIPCIFPGFNEPNAPTQRIIEKTESNYVDYCNVAKRNMSASQIVMINSWNDFAKGTAIEPSVKHNKLFLEITKREFKVK